MQATPKDPTARLTLRAIEAFVAVVEAGSLAEAARRLEASPSALSQQLTNLESAVGARLLDRTARPIDLTPAGRVFIGHARGALDSLLKARAELSEGRFAALPELRLAMIEDFDADVTPTLLLALAEMLPVGTVLCRTGLSHANLEALMARSVDLAVAADSDPTPPDLERHALVRDPFVLVVAKGLLAEGKGEGEGENLRSALGRAPMTGFAEPQIIRRQIAAQLQRLRFDAAPRFAVDTNHAAMALVARTGGWTITTALGYLRTPQVHAALEMRPLPFAGFARHLSLYASAGTLGSLPGLTAHALRTAIAERAVEPARALAPWLDDAIRLLDTPEH
ncbi:MAG: LysR family transcriptional regulator [Pseudomonadota bacterium]